MTLDELRVYMKETHRLREAHGQGIPWWSAEYGPERAPVVGARAPDGPLKSAGLSRTSTLLQVVREAASKGPPESTRRWFSPPKARKGLVGVIFYSATCRVWNWGGVWTFPQLLNDYGVPIVFVYVSEYAVTDADALTDSRYVPVVDQPKEENWKAANCLLFGVPMVAAALGWRPDRVDQYVDGMDRALEQRVRGGPLEACMWLMRRRPKSRSGRGRASSERDREGPRDCGHVATSSRRTEGLILRPLFYCYTVHVRFFATYNPTSLRLNKLGVANGSW